MLQLQSVTKSIVPQPDAFADEVERDPFCQQVLRCRMRDGLLSQGDIIEDVRGFTPPKHVASRATGLLAGFPCQATHLN